MYAALRGGTGSPPTLQPPSPRTHNSHTSLPPKDEEAFPMYSLLSSSEVSPRLVLQSWGATPLTSNPAERV